MPRRIAKVDFKELQEFQEKVAKLNDEQVDTFFKDTTNQLASRFYARAVKGTPVGVYPKASGKKGGTLRRGWKITRNGSRKFNKYEADVTNLVEYASYVENGHRTHGGRGWVEGQFYQKKAEEQTLEEAPKIINKQLDELLKGIK